MTVETAEKKSRTPQTGARTVGLAPEHLRPRVHPVLMIAIAAAFAASLVFGFLAALSNGSLKEELARTQTALDELKKQQTQVSQEKDDLETELKAQTEMTRFQVDNLTERTSSLQKQLAIVEMDSHGKDATIGRLQIVCSRFLDQKRKLAGLFRRASRGAVSEPPATSESPAVSASARF